MDSPVNSFLRFVIGFSVFISVSFGVTYAVQAAAVQKDKAAQSAAALQAMLEPYTAAR